MLQRLQSTSKTNHKLSRFWAKKGKKKNLL
jgi:hypothetical protein